ncbi:hypothetical protein KA021_00170 [Candidatus Saccharibacteria bacterium]|nr:hypothetical protein [Candidatus Saccharibacteria bacterium]
MFEGPIAFEKPSIVRVRRLTTFDSWRLATSFGDSSANRVSRAVELARYIRGALEDVELYGIDVFDTDDPGIILAFGARAYSVGVLALTAREVTGQHMQQSPELYLPKSTMSDTDKEAFGLVGDLELVSGLVRDMCRVHDTRLSIVGAVSAVAIVGDKFNDFSDFLPLNSS